MGYRSGWKGFLPGRGFREGSSCQTMLPTPESCLKRQSVGPSAANMHNFIDEKHSRASSKAHTLSVFQLPICLINLHYIPPDEAKGRNLEKAVTSPMHGLRPAVDSCHFFPARTHKRRTWLRNQHPTSVHPINIFCVFDLFYQVTKLANTK